MNEEISLLAWPLPARSWWVFRMEPQVAFLELWWVFPSSLGHTVISLALNFQPSGVLVGEKILLVGASELLWAFLLGLAK